MVGGRLNAEDRKAELTSGRNDDGGERNMVVCK